VKSPRKIGLIHLIPVSISLVFSYFSAILFKSSNLLEEDIAPFLREESIGAVLYNVFLFIGLVCIGTAIMLFLSLRRKLNILRLFFILSISIALFSFYQLYILSITVLLPRSLAETLGSDVFIFPVSLVLTTATSYLVFFSRNEFLVMLLTVFYASGIGALFGTILPFWSIVAIGLTMSAYDLFSVFKGPLKKFIESISERDSELPFKYPKQTLLRGVTVPFKGINIGVGDIVFYSMFNASVFQLRNYTPIVTLALFATITAGVFVTLRLLEKYRALPALPLPIILSIILLLLWNSL